MTSSQGIIQGIASSANLPVDLVKIISLMIFNIPLSYIFHFIHKPNHRLLYSLIPGLISLIYLLQHWTLYILAVALVPFMLFKVIKKNEYLISVVTSASFLLFIHVYRFIYDYMGWKIDCSVAVMYLVTKIVYYGHYIQNNNHNHNHHHNKHKQDNNRQDHRQDNANIFQYLSYCFYFPSILIGPAFSYTIFRNFIHKINGYQNPQICRNLLLKQSIKTVGFAIATGLLMPIFTPYWALQNEWYLRLPSLMQLLLLNIIGVCYRIKFYVAWGLAQMAVDLSGLSWSQSTQNYSSVRCGSPRFQTQLNPRNKTAYWNTSIQIWLKQMFFDKISSATNSTALATFVTFFISASWHGVYLTYYVGFIQWAVIITISKWAYRMSQALPKLANSVVVRIMAFVVASSLLNYTGMFIVVLTWNQATKCYSNMNYIGNVIMAVLLAASFVIKPSMFRGKHSKKHRDHSKKDEQQSQTTANASADTHNHTQAKQEETDLLKAKQRNQ